MECELKRTEPSLDISRRKFFTSTIMLLGGMITSVLGWNIGRYFISPAWKQAMKEGWVEVVSLEALPVGVPEKLNYVQRRPDGWTTVEDESAVWFLRENDKVTAFNPRCTHLGCPYEWNDEKNLFECPCHTASFSKTGEIVGKSPAPRALDRFPAQIIGGVVLILPDSKKGGQK